MRKIVNKGKDNKKKYILFTIVTVLSLAVLNTSLNCQNFTRANENDEKELYMSRDVDLELDSSGNLNIKRSELKDTPMGEDNWSIFVYMTGSDLESNYENASKDIKEMFEANSISEDINIIIQTGGCGKWHVSDIESSAIGRYKLNGDKLEKLDSLPLKSMGKSDTLYNFLEWGVNNYPAEHMGVVFWNHGSGISKGLCIDTVFEDDALSLAEVEYAMARLNDNVLTDRFELIGFDTCLSGSIEYANMLATYAKYMVASADVEPNDGWFYTDFIKYLNENSDADGESVGKVIVDSYAGFYTGIKGEYATLATYDLSKTDDVCVEINAFAKDVYEIYKKNDDISEILDIIGSPKIYTYGNMDLGSLVESLKEKDSLNNYDVSKLEKSLEKLVIYNSIGSGYKEKGCNGITMFAPLSLMSLNDFNVCRNALVSPYMLSILEATNYYAMKNEAKIYGKELSYEVNDWDNTEYFYEDTFAYMEYEDMLKTDEQVYKLIKKNDDYTFVNTWYNLIKAYNEAIKVPNTPSEPSFGGGFGGGHGNDFGGGFGGGFGMRSNTVTAKIEDTTNISDVYNALFYKDGEDIIYLGEQSSTDYNKNTGEMSSKGVQEWFGLPDGQLLSTHIIERSENMTIYGFPVVIDEVESTIRIRETFDNESGEKQYELLGVWDATENSNYAPRGFLPLEVGTVITPIYDVYNMDTMQYDTSYGEEYEIKSEYDFMLIDVDDKNYFSTFVVDMLIGNSIFKDNLSSL